MPVKPSGNEEDFIRRHEADLLAKRRKEADAKRAAEEREQAKQLHFMRCPKCGHHLKEEHYHGVAVDRCSACKGIWFDAGEAEGLLDKEPGALQGFFGDLVKGFGGSTKKK